FPTTKIHQRKRDTSQKSKLTEESVSIKDPSFQTPISEPISPPLSSRSYQNSTEKDSFYLEKQSPSTSPSIRPHTTINDQTYSLGSFQRNSNIRQTTSTKSQHQQQISSSSTINNNDWDETKPNFTKFYTNKTFTLRQQTSHLSSSTSKPIQQQQQIPSKTLLQQNSKPITTMLSTSLSTINSSRQTNRTVQLRRARAQAKIEELSQRTTKQLHKTDHQSDIMNTSSHSNFINHSKKELTNLQSNSQTITRTNITSPRQDMLKTRTISSSSKHRSASASPQLYKETPSRYRKTMTSIVTDEEQCQKASTSVCSIEEERCDSLRDNGQRLAIRLIQLSSGILEKLKPNESVTDDNISIRELEQLVDKLETINKNRKTKNKIYFSDAMRQPYHSILKWSFLTGTSTILLKLCYESLYNVSLRTSNKPMSTYENTLISWASTGQRSKTIKNKLIDTNIRDDLQLIGAQIYFRHGARTPLSSLPGLEEVSYTKEHIDIYPPSKWNIKLITKIGNDIVSEDKILSANDVIGDRIKQLKSTSDVKVVTGQLTAIGEKQLYQLGKLIRSQIIKEDNNGLIPNIYHSNIV
ncbi:unnamed protein product, partial [Rotaria sp. Silwood2]